jgi:Rieske Fe-S protein
MPEQNRPSSRREFLKLLQGLLAAIGASAILGPILAFFWPSKLEDVPSEPVPVGAPDSIAVGESKTIAYGRYPALIINTEDGIRAYSAVCTHFACIVKWNAETQMIECPCHEAFFAAADGAVLDGPAPRPLDAIATFVQGDVLFIGSEA